VSSAPPSLVGLQTSLMDLLRRDASLTADVDASARAAEIATGNDRLTGVEQVDIYREQYFLRHVGALRDDFESLVALLGEDGFDALARAYLAAHPPTSFTLRDLGHALPAFVASHAPWSEDTLVADMARLEWAFVDAFDAAEAPKIELAAIASMPEEAWPLARVRLHPSVQLVEMRHLAEDYRSQARKLLAGELTELPRPEPGARYVVVFRGSEKLKYIDVDRGAFALLCALRDGLALGDACERAASAAEMPEEAFQEALGGWFQSWTSWGWITALERAA
jgi:hypothetical protein